MNYKKLKAKEGVNLFKKGHKGKFISFIKNDTLYLAVITKYKENPDTDWYDNIVFNVMVVNHKKFVHNIKAVVNSDYSELNKFILITDTLKTYDFEVEVGLGLWNSGSDWKWSRAVVDQLVNDKKLSKK